MADASPLKKHRKVAAEMFEQIERLTARWHLNFSEVELNVLGKALAAYSSEKGPKP